MGVRLGFAVAAHLEPDILIVDEVLAVGDASFQKKCLGKMEEVAGHGRTVLFVSHNMNTVTRLCPRAILLQEGRVLADGPSSEVTQLYLHSDQGTIAERSWTDPRRAPGNSVARLRAIRIRNEAGKTTSTLDIRHPVGIEVTFEVLESGHVLTPNHHFYNDEGICVFIANATNDPAARAPRARGLHTSTMWIPGNFLAEGTLLVTTVLSTFDPLVIHYTERDAVAFQVVDSLDGDSTRGNYAGPYPGVVRPQFQWETSHQGVGASIY
jgi:lipopolysaccharide transport system ATP-binding protein